MGCCELSHSSVAVVLYHTTRNAFILVRQFRPAVYAATFRDVVEERGNNDDDDDASIVLPLECGLTFELCAGIVGDKPELSLLQIAQEEILEECGFRVPLDGITKVTSFLTAVGISGSRQTIFAAKVDDSMGGGGGGLAEHGEAIEVVALPAESVEAFIMDETVGKSSGLMWALSWAMHSGFLV